MKITTMRSVRNEDRRVFNITWSELKKKLMNPVVGPKGSAGAYIAGATTLDDLGKRITLTREAIVLDIDNPNAVEDPFEKVKEYEFFVHTTASATKDNKRLRVIFPLAEAITEPEDYRLLANALMFLMSPKDCVNTKENRAFDWSCNEFNRLMFFPTKEASESLFETTYNVGKLLNFEEFNDTEGILTELITGCKSCEEVAYAIGLVDSSPKKATPACKSHTSYTSASYLEPFEDRGDPRELDSIVGSFCKVYNIEEAILEFELPYEEAGYGRLKYEPSSSPPGAMIDDSGHYFLSKHETDPACTGHFENAYDLVRLHIFPPAIHGEDKSKRLMWSFAMEDPAVKEIEKPRYLKHKNKYKN